MDRPLEFSNAPRRPSSGELLATVSDPDALFTSLEWMRGLARRLVSPSDADDIGQQALLVSLERPREDLPVRVRLRGLLRGLSGSLRRAEKARRRREVAVARAEASPSAAELVECAELQRRLVGFVLELESGQRDAILLRFFGGMDAAEIARELGLQSDTVRKRVQRGLAALRERLDKADGHRESWVPSLAAFATGTSSSAWVSGTTKAASGVLAMKTKAWVVAVAAALLLSCTFFFGKLLLRPPILEPVVEQSAPNSVATAEAPDLRSRTPALSSDHAPVETNAFVAEEEATEDPRPRTTNERRIGTANMFQVYAATTGEQLPLARVYRYEDALAPFDPNTQSSEPLIDGRYAPLGTSPWIVVTCPGYAPRVFRREALLAKHDRRAELYFAHGTRVELVDAHRRPLANVLVRGGTHLPVTAAPDKTTALRTPVCDVGRRFVLRTDEFGEFVIPSLPGPKATFEALTLGHVFAREEPELVLPRAAVADTLRVPMLTVVVAAIAVRCSKPWLFDCSLRNDPLLLPFDPRVDPSGFFPAYRGQRDDLVSTIERLVREQLSLDSEDRIVVLTAVVKGVPAPNLQGFAEIKTPSGTEQVSVMLSTLERFSAFDLARVALDATQQVSGQGFASVRLPAGVPSTEPISLSLLLRKGRPRVPFRLTPYPPLVPDSDVALSLPPKQYDVTLEGHLAEDAQRLTLALREHEEIQASLASKSVPEIRTLAVEDDYGRPVKHLRIELKKPRVTYVFDSTPIRVPIGHGTFRGDLVAGDKRGVRLPLNLRKGQKYGEQRIVLPEFPDE